MTSSRASTRNVPSTVFSKTRSSRSQAKHGSGSRRRQREPASFGQPARRRRHDDVPRQAAANVARKRGTSRCDTAGAASRERMSRERSSSPMTPRATAVLAPACATAARYAATFPPKRSRTIRRSSASVAEGETRVRSRSMARTTRAVRASSRSPVSFASAATLAAVIGAVPYTQRVPDGRFSWPRLTSASSSFRAARARRTGSRREPRARRTQRRSCPDRSSARRAAPSPTTRRAPVRARAPPGEPRAPAT